MGIWDQIHTAQVIHGLKLQRFYFGKYFVIDSSVPFCTPSHQYLYVQRKLCNGHQIQHQIQSIASTWNVRWLWNQYISFVNFKIVSWIKLLNIYRCISLGWELPNRGQRMHCEQPLYGTFWNILKISLERKMWNLGTVSAVGRWMRTQNGGGCMISTMPLQYNNQKWNISRPPQS